MLRERERERQRERERERERELEERMLLAFGPRGSDKRDAYDMYTACSTAQYEQNSWHIFHADGAPQATSGDEDARQTQMQEQHRKMFEANAQCIKLATLFAVRTLIGPTR